MNVPKSRYSNEETGRIGEELYRRDFRSQVMPQHKGKFLVAGY